MNKDFEPLRTFLQEEISPVDLSNLLDDFLFDYTDKLIRLQHADCEQSLHIDTAKFLYIIRSLRDALIKC